MCTYYTDTKGGIHSRLMSNLLPWRTTKMPVPPSSCSVHSESSVNLSGH